MTDSQRAVLREAIDTYGKDNQLWMVSERVISSVFGLTDYEKILGMKVELRLLMGTESAEECECAFDRMIKISQCSTLSIEEVLRTISRRVCAGCGTVENILRRLEQRYT